MIPVKIILTPPRPFNNTVEKRRQMSPINEKMLTIISELQKHPGVFLEGWLARQAYASLYRMHQLSIHGAPKTGLAWLVDKLNRYLKPRMKLH